MMRYFVTLSLLLWTNTASAVPLTDIVNAGSFTTSNGLTFSNFQVALTYNIPPPPSVEGLVTTRQASLSDLQLTPLPNGFQVTGFAWEGTLIRTTTGRFGEAPFSTTLALTYTVSGLGGESPSGFGPRVSAGAFATGGFPLTSLTVTPPTGEQFRTLACPSVSCTVPIADLPLGTTEATVRDTTSISPLLSCAPDFSRCGGFNIGTAASASSFQTAPIPEPSTWLLLATGSAALLFSRKQFVL
jgi:hypothetical protein